MKLEKLIGTALGNNKADLVIKNANIVDVFCGKITKGDVAVTDGVIVGIGEYSGENEYDAEGKYLMPGFIDAHVHIESSMVTPSEYSRLVIPKGVTSVVCDPHEIANVSGIDGIKFMMDDAKDAPLKFNFMLPSCVPATDFESSGAVIDAKDTKEFLEKYDFLGLAEMMNYPGLIYCDREVLEKVESSEIIDGHAPLLSGKELMAYAVTGIRTDHECSNVEEMNEKISLGMYAILRCGMHTKEFCEMVSGVDKNTVNRIAFCTDDKNAQYINETGTIQYCIQNAVNAGMDPIDAIKAATINPANCYGLKKLGAVAPGFKADLVLCENLVPDTIKAVWKDGVLVGKDGKDVYVTKKTANPEKVYNSVNIPDISADDLVCEFDKKTPVISVIPGSLVNKKVYKDSADGLTHLACIERHKASGNIGRCYVENYMFKNGAIASCIGHDSHNVTVAGDNKEDMLIAVNALGKSGGITVVSNGEVIGKLSLPVGGLMSDMPWEEVAKGHKEIEEAGKKVLVNAEIDPFMVLSFLPLPVIPELRLTDKGLFDVIDFKLL